MRCRRNSEGALIGEGSGAGVHAEDHGHEAQQRGTWGTTPKASIYGAKREQRALARLTTTKGRPLVFTAWGTFAGQGEQMRAIERKVASRFKRRALGAWGECGPRPGRHVDFERRPAEKRGETCPINFVRAAGRSCSAAPSLSRPARQMVHLQ